MGERIDHAYLAMSAEVSTVWPADDTEAIAASATFALMHATLALVEEQRTANLIAYAQLLEMQYAEARKHGPEFDWSTREESIARHGSALARIREGLGL